MTDKEQWVVWNGSMGILDMATIGLVEEGESGKKNAWLAPPYGVVGPFSLNELVAQGRIAFGECLIMSRLRWQEDQVELRLEAREKRRAFQDRFNEQFNSWRGDDEDEEDDEPHRIMLDLPLEGRLQPSEINAAFRRLAKKAHPDAGGSSEHYRRITSARDALLEQFTGA